MPITTILNYYFIFFIISFFFIIMPKMLLDQKKKKSLLRDISGILLIITTAVNNGIFSKYPVVCFLKTGYDYYSSLIYKMLCLEFRLEESTKTHISKYFRVCCYRQLYNLYKILLSPITYREILYLYKNILNTTISLVSLIVKVLVYSTKCFIAGYVPKLSDSVNSRKVGVFDLLASFMVTALHSTHQ